MIGPSRPVKLSDLFFCLGLSAFASTSFGCRNDAAPADDVRPRQPPELPRAVAPAELTPEDEKSIRDLVRTYGGRRGPVDDLVVCCSVEGSSSFEPACPEVPSTWRHNIGEYDLQAWPKKGASVFADPFVGGVAYGGHLGWDPVEGYAVYMYSVLFVRDDDGQWRVVVHPVYENVVEPALWMGSGTVPESWWGRDTRVSACVANALGRDPKVTASLFVHGESERRKRWEAAENKDRCVNGWPNGDLTGRRAPQCDGLNK